MAKIADVRLDLSADIAGVRGDLAIRIESSKNETIRWVFGLVGFQSVVMISAALLLSYAGHG